MSYCFIEQYISMEQVSFSFPAWPGLQPITRCCYRCCHFNPWTMTSWAKCDAIQTLAFKKCVHTVILLSALLLDGLNKPGRGHMSCSQVRLWQSEDSWNFLFIFPEESVCDCRVWTSFSYKCVELLTSFPTGATHAKNVHTHHTVRRFGSKCPAKQSMSFIYYS